MAVYENRLVTFVDMLGFSEFVRRSARAPELVKWLSDAVEAAKASDIYTRQFGATGHPEDSLQITNFSDSIVISDVADEVGFGQVMFATMEVVVRLQYLGILSRGGIGYGPLFHKDNALFGPAFLEAYEMERAVAGMPQIVFSAAAVRFLDGLCAENAEWGRWLSRLTVMETAPRLIRLEPFHIFHDERLFAQMRLPFTIAEFCQRGRDFTVMRLRECIDEPRTFQKYEWHARRLNALIAARAPEVAPIDLTNIFEHFRPGGAPRG